jgi:hypothetical protein
VSGRSLTRTHEARPPEKQNTGPLHGGRRLDEKPSHATESNLARPVNRLTRSKLVFRAYVDAKLYGDADEAAELFELWLRLLGKDRP